MSVRVYVAGGSSELERCEAVIAALREAGAVISHDWCAEVRAARAHGVASDADCTDAEAHKAALHDIIDGALAADVIVYLAPERPSYGAGFECGAAWGGGTIGRPLWIVAGPHARASIFTRLAHAIVDTDAEAVAWAMERGR